MNAQAFDGLLKAVTPLQALGGASESREATRRKGRIQKQIKIQMGYFQEVDRWLDVIFADLADGKMSFDELKRDIRNRILESYRNGVKATGQSPTPRESNPRRFRKRTHAG
jgi:hypothetical protein